MTKDFIFCLISGFTKVIVISFSPPILSQSSSIRKSGTILSAISTKLQRLLDGYLEQDIEKETYRVEKAKLILQKKSLEEQMARIEQKRTGWLEPALGEPHQSLRSGKNRKV